MMYWELVVGVCVNCLVIIYNFFEYGCLWLFLYVEWEWVWDEVNVLFSVKVVYCNMQMKLVGVVVVVELDSVVCILLLVSQCGIIGIEKWVVLLGMGNKFELWSEQVYLVKICQIIGEDDIISDMVELCF